MSVPGGSLLSVVVVIVSDTMDRRAGTGNLRGCLEALSKQIDAPPMEVIVPHHPATGGIEDLRKGFPEVSFIAVTGLRTSPGEGSREHHDVLRARGLAAASGDVVGLLEDHGRPDDHWSSNVMTAHRGVYAAIGGAIENGIDRPLNWAVYYCDFGRYQPPFPPGESSFASDANVTYKRSALKAIRATWAGSFREVVVNEALRSRGEKVALQSSIVVYQNRRDLRFGTALLERFVWGRSYAATRTAQLGGRKRVTYAVLSPLLPLILLLRMAGTAWNRRRHFAQFLRAFPLTAVLVTVWSIGEGVGYATAR